MYDEAKVRLIEAHAEGNGCDQSLDTISKQILFGSDSAGCLEIGMIFAGGDAAVRQPGGDAPRVLDGKCIDDAAAWKFWEKMGEPSETLGLVMQPDVEKL